MNTLNMMPKSESSATPQLLPLQESLADRLRRARKQKGWSQEFLAQRAETSQAVIQKIENGKSLRPRNIEHIANALSVRPAWLMFGVNEVEDLDEDAVQVARAWARLKEPERSAMQETIRRLADG
jgi:transcriptional regulator with XRE-family HTH domain